MQFSIKAIVPESAQSGCLVVGVYEGAKLSPSAKSMDTSLGGLITAMFASGDADGTKGSIRILYPSATCPGRLVLVGLGPDAPLSPKTFRDIVRSAITAVAGTGSKDAVAYLTEINVLERDEEWKARQVVQIASECLYRFEQLKSNKSAPRRLKQFSLGVSAKSKHALVKKGLVEGLAISAGIELAKDLGNLPGNHCTPAYLASTAQDLARDWKMECKILERKDAERLGMGTFLSVARGSAQPPKFVILQYRGASRKEKPIVLIGKGITFDTGGISLKPGSEMDEMKFDMCGAGSVLGTMRAVAELKLNLNVICIVPATENMPDGAATKPGDIVTSMSGQSVEILNTDAEGRLILADALTYAERFDPQAVIDVATLTGACVIALGHVCSAVYSNNDGLASEIVSAGENAFDRTWQMPLWDDYQDLLKSNFADVANIGGRAAGSITAACFLSRFARKFEWAHLDIAGVAWQSGKEKGATGRPVALLTSFLIRRDSAGRRSK